MASIDGVVSGLDTTALIEATVAGETLRLQGLEDQQADLRDRKSKISELNSLLSTLSDEILALGSPDSLALFTSDLDEDEDQFGVSFGAGTQAGTYAVQVLQTATLSSFVSDQGYADRAAAGVFSTGTFDVTVGGETSQITIDASDTLDTISGKLNAVGGVTSYVVDTGSVTDPFKLVVSGQETGLENAVTIDNFALAGGVDLGFADPNVEGSVAQDAQVSVNGLVLNQPTNDFEDVIPGLDINAKQAGAGPVIFSVQRDDDAIAEKIEAFTTAYNGVRTFYDVNTVFDEETGLRGPLIGDSTARRVVDELGSLVAGNYLGNGSDYFGLSLSRLGILTTQDGTLEFERDTFDDLIDDDPALVRAIFSSDALYSANYSDPSDAIGATGTFRVTAGERVVEGVSIDATDSLTDVAATLNGLRGVNAEVVQDGSQYRLFVTSTGDEDSLFDIQVTSGDLENVFLYGDADEDGNKPFEGGPLGSIVGTIQDLFIGDDGLLDVRSESLDSQIDDLDGQIDSQQARIESEVERLRAKFTALEVTLGQLQSTQNQLSAILPAAALF